MEQHCCYKKRAYACISIQELKTYQVVPEEGMGSTQETKRRKGNGDEVDALNKKLIAALERECKLKDTIIAMLSRPTHEIQNRKPATLSVPSSPKRSEYLLVEGSKSGEGLTGRLLHASSSSGETAVTTTTTKGTKTQDLSARYSPDQARLEDFGQ